ncbi:hypothetical protein GCM10007989_15100 [Devosia pacifica]|uniref:YlxR domain-containing protein n=1 Tax=Devosia pacifica TaxID=1335967 RepID=A0A918S567_9HYPH|nr:RNA-binding protein [Devosia pacifica]GHA20915.1 hypothetical protein GCM10007989_15100 [Devosia pacifica]
MAKSPSSTERMCALTRAHKPISELIRFVLSPDGVLVPDTEAKAEGRGVWISLDAASVTEAARKNVFARSLKTAVTVPDGLAELTAERLQQRFAASLSMARKAGQLVTGSTKVRVAIESGDILALVTATDAAPDGRNKMMSAVRALQYAAKEDGDADFSVPHLELLSSDQLGLALGLENVIHAALTTGAAAQAALEKGQRLAHYGARTEESDHRRTTRSGVALPHETR